MDSKGNQVQTVLEYRNGLMSWLAVGVMLVFGLWCCACVPLCLNAFKDVYHISPTDGSVVGVYQRIK